VRVSVVIVAFNVEDFILDSVRSMLDQTYKDLQVIVVDDCSTDQTLERLHEINDQRLIIHQLPVHCGIATARNIGARLAQNSEFIAVMDGDDLSLPKRIESQVAFMDENKSVHIAGAQIKVFRGAPDNITLSPTHPLTDDLIKARLLLINGTALIHPTTMMRTDFLQRHHLEYPPPVRGYLGIDHDFWISTIPRGVVFASQPDVTLLKRVHDTNVSRRSTEGGRLAALKTISRTRLLGDFFPDLTRREVHALALLLEEHRPLNFQQLGLGLAALQRASQFPKSTFGENKRAVLQMLRQALNARQPKGTGKP
jgi:glycosyltransferase involved in cell wall biosynthesis